MYSSKRSACLGDDLEPPMLRYPGPPPRPPLWLVFGSCHLSLEAWGRGLQKGLRQPAPLFQVPHWAPAVVNTGSLPSSPPPSLPPPLSSSELGVTHPYPCPVQWSHVCMGGMVRRGRGPVHVPRPVPLTTSPRPPEPSPGGRVLATCCRPPPPSQAHASGAHVVGCDRGQCLKGPSFIEGHDLVCVVDQAGPVNWAL